MSMNDNLEGKVSELTEVVRGLSDRSLVNSNDINNIVTNLSRRVDENTERGFDRLTNNLSQSLLDRLEDKHNEIKESLSFIENFASHIERNIQNPKVEAEITRILNDIEALHSKMGSQEIQTEKLAKNFDTFKNSTSAGQITKLCDEVTSISKAYDGIVEVLNNNFQEFLRRVEIISGKEEIQRIMHNLETVEGNQNVLVAAMNEVNDKQDEIKALIRQSWANDDGAKLEQLQNALNQVNRLITDTATKADVDVLTNKFTNIHSILTDLKTSSLNNSNSGINTVFSSQLNNIISKLENIKTGSNSSEDLIKLYSSISELKDSVYNSINSQVNGLVASMNIQFDKITASLLNTNTDSNEAMVTLTNEVQKLNNMVLDGLNSKTAEIKQNFQQFGHDNVITIVNSIKGELSTLIGDIATLGNSKNISNLVKTFENLQKGFDLNSLVVQMDKIRAALDFDTLKEQIAILNKDELIKSINQKIDLILNYSQSNEILSRLDDIKANQGAVTGSIDFTSIEAKLVTIKDILVGGNFSDDLAYIRGKLSQIEGLSGELSSFKNIEEILIDIKTQMEANVNTNIQKLNDDKQNLDELKEALKTIYKLILDTSDTKKFDELTTELKEALTSLPLKIDATIERDRTGIERVLSTIGDKLTGIDLKIAGGGDEKFVEIKEQLEILYEFIKEINSKSINEQIDALKASILTINTDNTKAIADKISEFQNSLALSFTAIKNGIDEHLNSSRMGEPLIPFFDVLSEKLTEKITSIETLIEETGSLEAEKTKAAVVDGLEGFKNDIKIGISNFVEQLMEVKTGALAEMIRNQTNESKIEVANYLKQESEILSSFFVERTEASNRDLIDKFSQVITAKENSEAKINLVRNVTEGISELLNMSNALKGGYELNNDLLNEINNGIGLINAKLDEAKNEENAAKNDISPIQNYNQGYNAEYEEILDKIAKNLEVINNKVSKTQDFDNDDRIADALSILNSEMQDKMNIITANSELLDANFKDIVAQNNSDLKGAITEIGENLNSNTQKINENLLETSANIENSLTTLSEHIRAINLKFDSPAGLSDGGSIIDALDDLNRNFISIQDRIEDLVLSGDKNSDEGFSIKTELENKIEEVKIALQNKFEEIENAIEDKLESEAKTSNMFVDLNATLEQKLSDKISNIEALINDGSISDKIIDLNEKISTIETLINNNSASDKILDLSEKISALSTLFDENINKMGMESSEAIETNKDTIQEKFEEFCNLSNENSQVLKNELQMQSEALSEKIAKIETALVNQAAKEENLPYSFTEIAGDIAKIRLGIEKNNKLSNFKEFAARLVELKNINLENAKISRVIGSDIMRFDAWLKNTTAKIDMLASKIDKTEKIKMDDLKAKLSEKGQSSPQRSDDVLMSVYKKYRAQETKLDEIASKIDSYQRRQSESFDIKEFIDLFYDNMKKQENLMNRMDGLEDKMDIIQSKIDHIINACIDD